jgi:3D-(3,5/4)-trihydroxycyclohexane-1,2-dione acylhydrolase (decyclizing)
VGDGSYLMMSSELVTAIQERVKLVVVLVQNHGYQSIGALSESVGSQRFGTKYRYRNTDDTLPVDLAQSAAGLGARVFDVSSVPDLEDALREAIAADVTCVVQVHTDPSVPAPDSEAWWDVPVSEVAGLQTTRDARAVYERNKATQHSYLRTPETVRTP